MVSAAVAVVSAGLVTASCAFSFSVEHELAVVLQVLSSVLISFSVTDIVPPLAFRELNSNCRSNGQAIYPIAVA